MGKSARDVRVREGNFTLRLELDRKCSKTGLPISGKLAVGAGHAGSCVVASVRKGCCINVSTCRNVFDDNKICDT